MGSEMCIRDRPEPPLPFGGLCTSYVGIKPLTFLAPTDAAGSLSFPFPIPNEPALLGFSFTLQWAVIDPGGVLASVSLSDALEVVLGP